MVSTCLRGRSLLGACSEKTEKQKARSVPAAHCTSAKTHHRVSCCVTSRHLFSCYVQATLSTILCPNVAWSRVGLHLECVGPSIIPLCKYLHKETSLLALAKSRESNPWNSLFQSHIQLWPEREMIKPAETEGGGEKKGTEEKDKRRRNEKDRQDRLREKRRQMDRQAWWCRGREMKVKREVQGREQKKKRSEQSLSS